MAAMRFLHGLTEPEPLFSLILSDRHLPDIG